MAPLQAERQAYLLYSLYVEASTDNERDASGRQVRRGETIRRALANRRRRVARLGQTSIRTGRCSHSLLESDRVYHLAGVRLVTGTHVRRARVLTAGRAMLCVRVLLIAVSRLESTFLRA